MTPTPRGTRHGHMGLLGLRMLVFLAWRNLWRNRMRSALTIAAMVVGISLMIPYLSLMEGLFRQLVGFATDITIGHLQVQRAAYIEDQDLYATLPWPLVKQLEESTPYRYAPRSYAAGLASAGDQSSGTLLEGIDPQREARVTSLHRRVREGRFDFSQVRRMFPHGPDGPAVPAYPVVIGRNVAKNLQVKLGSEIVLITQAADGSIGNGLFYVVGVMNPISPAFDRMGVIMTLQAFNSLMFLDEGVHELAVGTDDVAGLDAAKARIQAAVAAWPGTATLADDPGGPVRVRTWKEINPDLFDMITQAQAMTYILALIIFVIAAMVILNTMLMATYERRHEMGILLALGMGRVAMMAMVMLEAFFLACFATVLGSLCGGALAWYLQVYGFDYSAWLPEGLDFMGVIMDPVYYGYTLPEHFVVSAVISLATALLAAVLPSWRTARLKPALALYQ